MSKPVYLDLLILEINKIVMYEFRYDYAKTNYGEKAKLCCTDTDSFIVYIKASDIYSDIAKDVETRFDTTSYKLDKPLPIGKNKKEINLIKDEFGGKIIKEFAALTVKTYSYLTNKNVKIKGTKKRMIKRKLKFEDYKHCLEATQLENKINHLKIYNLNVDNLQENHEELIKNNKLILKSQQRFRVEIIMYLLKKLTRLHCVLMIIKENSQYVQ